METSEHDQVVMGLLDAVLATPRDERRVYLRSTGSSPEVVAEVLERAEWEERMGGFLQTPLLALALKESDATQEDAPATPHPRKIGHYLIQRELGRGGMGVVFEAIDENLGRTIALKVLSETAASENDRRRFLREAKAASALNHPNIVAIHEFDSDAGRDYIAMEYIEGTTLDRALAPGVPLSTRLRYACKIALALAQAHAAGTVHRDLKPGNIMVTKQGEIKVLDFGLAKHSHAAAAIAESEATQTTDAITREGVLVGTPAYMSPEQVTGDAVDRRSDIFSFGVILYQMVCGERPFPGGSGAALLVQIAGKAHRPVRELNPSAPPALAALIDRCLAKKTEDRLPSIDLAAAELADIIEGLEKRSSARGFVPWIAAACLALAAAGGWLWEHRVRAPATAPPLHSLRFSVLNEQGVPTSAGGSFHSGSQFRFRITPSDAGFIYVINEGPAGNGRRQLVVLFPRPGGTAAAAAQEEMLTGTQVFDENPGVERTWVIWSQRPILSLDSAVSGPSRGEIPATDPTALEIEALLGRLQGEAKVSQASSGDEIQVHSTRAALASLIELKHQ